jgi:hypothetical protein
MTIIIYLVLLLLLFALYCLARNIHIKRTNNKYIDSYRWFVKIIK